MAGWTDAIALRAGALSTTLVDGRIGRINVCGHEVWHGVHFLLRDPHWRTPPLQCGPASHQVRDGGWRCVIEGHFEGVPGVQWRLTIDGTDELHTLQVSAEVHAAAEIEVNRLGLCLLHPLTAGGCAVDVRHVDGRVSRSRLPGEFIPPWPPFTGIASLRHEFAPGCWANAQFDGDDFELEDQRNNADASFKTYSRSNLMPRPYSLRPGTVMHQRVRLTVESLPEGAPVGSATAVAGGGHLRLGPTRIGVELQTADLADPDRAGDWIAAMGLGHVHVAVDALRIDGFDAAALATLLTRAGAHLRLDLVGLTRGGAQASLRRLAMRLRAAGVVPADLAVFPSTHEAVAAARAEFPATRIGGGTPDFFVQLNRAEDLPRLDFLSFTVCPTVHAADDETVMQSHASVGAMLATLTVRYPGVPVQVGPSSIAARRSPLGDLATGDGSRPLPLSGVDARDHGAFGADWIAGHVAELRRAGAQAVTVGRLAWCAPGSPVARRLGSLAAGQDRSPGWPMGLWRL